MILFYVGILFGFMPENRCRHIGYGTRGGDQLNRRLHGSESQRREQEKEGEAKEGFEHMIDLIC